MMKLNNLKVVGNYGARIGKTIVIEGVKAVAVNTAKTVVMTGFEDGLGSIKKLGWNDFLSDKEARIYKKAKKKETISELKSELAKLRKEKSEEVVVEVVEES